MVFCIFSHTNGYSDVGVVGEPETARDRPHRIREVADALLVAVRALVSPHGRIVIVEDSLGLAPNHPQAVLIEGRPANSELGGVISRTDLVRQSLRTRPDRLVG
jgi:hypothetical protein